MPIDTRAGIEAYANGINYYIDNYPNKLGVEFSLLRVKPSYWTGTHVMALVRGLSEP